MAGGGTDDMGGGMMTGTGTVTGDVNGGPFGTVSQAWMLGHPDSASTVVVYLFNKPVSCHDMTAMFGQMMWDQRIPSGTQFLEMKMFGPVTPTTPAIAPGTFTATTSMTPAPGEATVNQSLTAGATASAETSGSGGTIMVTSIVDKQSVAGTFNLTFTGGKTFTGSFNAGFCDVGVEP